jgi:hypothetical protein
MKVGSLVTFKQQGRSYTGLVERAEEDAVTVRLGYALARVPFSEMDAPIEVVQEPAALKDFDRALLFHHEPKETPT